MSTFPLYFELGFDHISDLNGYDHILFLVALCATYRINEWRSVLILVTAFTVGHSLTLALASLGYAPLRAEIVEFLIPVTILMTCLYNIIRPEREAISPSHELRFRGNYFLALFFGLIHGLGFSNYFQTLLGKETSIVQPLFAFNVGVEAGQLTIVAIIFLLLLIAQKVIRVRHRDWNLFVSGAAAGISLILMAETKFW